MLKIGAKIPRYHPTLFLEVSYSYREWTPFPTHFGKSAREGYGMLFSSGFHHPPALCMNFTTDLFVSFMAFICCKRYDIS